MFTAGLILSAGATIALATVERVLDETGFHWFGSTLKVLIPLAGMALAVYFLDHNALLRWLK